MGAKWLVPFVILVIAATASTALAETPVKGVCSGESVQSEDGTYSCRRPYGGGSVWAYYPVVHAQWEA